MPLKIASGALQNMGDFVPVVPDAVGVLRATLPGGHAVRLQRNPAPPGGVTVTIASGNPSSLLLLPDQTSLVYFERPVGDAKVSGYAIGYYPYEKNGQLHVSLSWAPAYRAVGRLQLPQCEIGIMVFDYNGDGVFDDRDHKRATTIGLDLNNDGLIQGVGEYRRAGEIIDTCGVPLQMSELDPQGASITFRVSEIRPAAVGSVVPQFSVVTTLGQILRSADFRSDTYVLDFWASWCAPCVTKLVAAGDLAKKHGSSVKVIGINVDEPERRELAEKIIREKALAFPQVMRAQGERDFLWKMFGSMPGVTLGIPLYVVIDGGGVIRYAASGGDDLVAVHQAIEKLVGR